MNPFTSLNEGGMNERSVGGMRSPRGTPGSSGPTGTSKFPPRFRVNQQRRKVGRGDLDSAKHQLGHEDSAVDDDDLRPVGHVDDEVATDHVNVIEVDAGRQGNDAVGTWNDLLCIIAD